MQLEQFYDIEGSRFFGPHHHHTKFQKDFGCVYLVINRNLQIIDVGETESFHSRLPNHDRLPQWERNNYYCVYVCPNNVRDSRLVLEKSILTKYNPICGDR
jgi:hypothetical protein